MHFPRDPPCVETLAVPGCAHTEALKRCRFHSRILSGRASSRTKMLLKVAKRQGLLLEHVPVPFVVFRLYNSLLCLIRGLKRESRFQATAAKEAVEAILPDAEVVDVP